VKELILKNIRIIICEFADMFVGILFTSVRSILKDKPKSGIQGIDFFHHDNASSSFVLEFLAKNMSFHTPLLTRFSGMQYLSFPKMQDGIKGKEI
jgi:hypothetical protein